MGAITAYWQGLGMGASLIIAIGAQNAFVLTQAIRGNHALAVSALCAALDAALIAAGVCGLGGLVAQSETLRFAACFGGAAFLLWFGARSLQAAFKPKGLTADAGAVQGLGPTLLATLGVSLLNPHVYLDTVVMLGAISGNYPGASRYAFGTGAVTASVLWFFSLSLAGKLLSPVFKKDRSWQCLHVVVCGVVWCVAAHLVYDYCNRI